MRSLVMSCGARAWDDAPRKMSPVRFHTLSPAERDLAVAELTR